MSRLWPERIRIGLAPDLMELAGFALGRAAEPRRRMSIACERGAGQSAWAAPLQALDQALPGFASRGDRATVVLSNAFVRYLVIPWEPEVSSPAELAALAAMRFRATFGDAAAAWTIRLGAGSFGEASVACAVETALVNDVRERLNAHRLRFTSLQPLLMAAYNEVRRELGRNSIFVTIEPGRLCVSVMRDGHWSHVASRRSTADPVQTVEQELAAVDAGAAPAQLDVLLVGERAFWPGNAARPARMLRASASGARSLALCGAG